MGQRIFVISDLHMAAKGCGFFSAHDALARFIDHVAGTPGEVDLVILGDALDYLQIKPYLSFTAPAAETKTQAIIDGNPGVFASLGRLLRQDGKRVRWAIGNHDLELVFPAARERLERAILGQPVGPGDRRLSWHLDGDHLDYEVANHAVIRLVHGNQSDGWNKVDYRAARDAVRAGTATDAIYPRGSRLVAEVLNPLHAQGFRHVHMLKPETTVALPLSLAFWPDETRQLLGAALPLFAGKTQDDIKRWLLKKLGLLRDEVYGPEVGSEADNAVDPLLAELSQTIEGSGLPLDEALAEDLGGWLSDGGSRALLQQYLDEPDAEVETFSPLGWVAKSLAALLHGAARIANGKANPWVLDQEDDLAATVKQMISEEHVAVVIAGHTHLARTVSYLGGYYINTGTWADLLRIPRAIPGQEFKDYARGLRDYLADPESCPFNLRPFRRLTYVEIDLGEAARPYPYRVRLREWPTESPKTLHQYP